MYFYIFQIILSYQSRSVFIWSSDMSQGAKILRGSTIYSNNKQRIVTVPNENAKLGKANSGPSRQGVFFAEGIENEDDNVMTEAASVSQQYF